MGIESWEKAIANLTCDPDIMNRIDEIEQDKLAIHTEESEDLKTFLHSKRGAVALQLLEAMNEKILIGVELDGKSSTTYYLSSQGLVVVYWAFDQTQDQISVVKDLREVVRIFHRQSFRSNSIIAWLNIKLDDLASSALL
ncbi:MAG: hypothetical protein R3B38_00130 [Patescibacteria group bacterium]